MKPDLDPTLFDALIEGSRRTACRDEAELRSHHDNLARRVQAQNEPFFSWAGFVFVLVVVLSLVAALVMWAAQPNASIPQTLFNWSKSQ